MTRQTLDGGAQDRVDLAHTFDMGYDCGKNGPNETNCYFGIFSERRFTDEWERGKKLAEEQKTRRPEWQRP